jgi:hypothetical protein
MTIYLMVKTHRKTGLKYLCKTIRNPLTYKGSGVDWKRHLKEYGIDHNTEIIRECASQKELYYWGSYYSKLWNVVGAMDDFGNKIWANRIPETGGGGATMTSEIAIRAHQNNPEARIKRKKTLSDPIVNAAYRAALILGKSNKSTKEKFSRANSGVNNPTYDSTIYTFIHKTGLIEICTQYDLRKKYSLDQAAICRIVHGIRKAHKGWRTATL